MMLISFVLIAVCLSLGDGQVTPLTIPDRLPGLDHLESGFNEVKMASLTVGDKQSRFRIFDLNEKGRHPFRLTLGNVDRLYETPLAGQVTNIGQRRDRTCESVATDFKQFYSRFAFDGQQLFSLCSFRLAFSNRPAVSVVGRASSSRARPPPTRP